MNDETEKKDVETPQEEKPEKKSPSRKEKKTAKAAKKGKKKKKKGTASTIILLLILLIGIGVFAYPSVSNWWNSMHASRAIASYVEAVDNMSEVEREQMLEAARAYNDSLPLGMHVTLSTAEFEEYMSLLDISGTGIMGYIQIPTIGVDLPIYHTVEETVLQIAVGHIPGSSLPVGGESCHTILSGHRGLPSAKLFTDLDRVVEGDIFTVTVLDQTVTYMVDQIRIVLPEQTGDLRIEEGMDYCTLVTCTPYGVNTHRMLVRGRRIDNIQGEVVVNSEANKIPTYIVVPAIGIPLLFVILFIMLIYYRTHKPRRTNRELLDEFAHKDNADDDAQDEPKKKRGRKNKKKAPEDPSKAEGTVSDNDERGDSQ